MSISAFAMPTVPLGDRCACGGMLRFGTDDLGRSTEQCDRCKTSRLMAHASTTIVRPARAAEAAVKTGPRNQPRGPHRKRPAAATRVMLRDLVEHPARPVHRCAHCGNMVMESGSGPINGVALAALAKDLNGCPADCWRFFELLFSESVRVRSVMDLAHEVGVCFTTISSRFGRAKVPNPKRYIALAEFVRAAWLFERPRATTQIVSFTLGGSSGQAFQHTCRVFLGQTITAFRKAHPTGQSMLDRFRAELVLPYVEQLRAFHPFAPEPRLRKVET